MTTESSIRGQYLKLIGAEFLTFVPVFLCHVILKLAVSRSRPPVPYGANLFDAVIFLFCSFFLIFSFLLPCDRIS